MLPVAEELSRHLKALCARHSIALAVAFGSRVRGQARQDSDLDLGLLFDGPADVLGLQSELQVLFPGLELDLAILNRADPLFLNEVNRNCQLLCGDPGRFQEFRRTAFHRYQDFRPYLRLEAETNRRHLEQFACP
jgi:predicted nucleotidyltransferase